jgi:hypothetical protein
MSGEWVSLGASDPEDPSTAKVKPSTAKVRQSHPSPFLFSFSLFFATFASTPTPTHAPPPPPGGRGGVSECGCERSKQTHTQLTHAPRTQVQLKRGYSFIHDNIDEESKAHDKGHDTEGLGFRE